jgi:hypothetical protein
MKKTENDVLRLFTEMSRMGLVTTGNSWIQSAIQQKNSKLPLAVANSGFLTYDQMDRKILTLHNSN